MVNVVSTLASPTDITSVNRQQDGTRVEVECPLCGLVQLVHGGVDVGLRGVKDWVQPK